MTQVTVNKNEAPEWVPLGRLPEQQWFEWDTGIGVVLGQRADGYTSVMFINGRSGHVTHSDSWIDRPVRALASVNLGTVNG